MPSPGCTADHASLRCCLYVHSDQRAPGAWQASARNAAPCSHALGDWQNMPHRAPGRQFGPAFDSPDPPGTPGAPQSARKHANRTRQDLADDLGSGAGDRNRTYDLRITNAPLYQLSYSGVLQCCHAAWRPPGSPHGAVDSRFRGDGGQCKGSPMAIRTWALAGRPSVSPGRCPGAPGRLAYDWPAPKDCRCIPQPQGAPVTQGTTHPPRAPVDAHGTDRLVAATVAIACNVACAWLLFQMPGAEPDGLQPAPLEVVWIQPVEPPARRLPLAATPAAKPAAVPRPRRPIMSERTMQPAPREVAHPEPVVPAPSPVVDQTEQPLPLEPLPAGALPPPGQQPVRPFAPDPFGPRLAPAGAAPNRMQLRMSDRSLGGRWRDLTRAATCGELRQKLHGSPESVLSIEASMRRLGCGAY